ncbi:hypothetical protein D3C80_1940220 [compost metagenome]
MCFSSSVRTSSGASTLSVKLGLSEMLATARASCDFSFDGNRLQPESSSTVVKKNAGRMAGVRVKRGWGMRLF